MTLSQDQIAALRTFGFKSRGKNQFYFTSFCLQTITINILNDSLELAIDGNRIYGTNLSFDNVLKIVTILYPDETRKRIRAFNSEYVSKFRTKCRNNA